MFKVRLNPLGSFMSRQACLAQKSCSNVAALADVVASPAHKAFLLLCGERQQLAANPCVLRAYWPSLSQGHFGIACILGCQTLEQVADCFVQMQRR